MLVACVLSDIHTPESDHVGCFFNFFMGARLHGRFNLVAFLFIVPVNVRTCASDVISRFPTEPYPWSKCTYASRSHVGLRAGHKELKDPGHSLCGLCRYVRPQ